ncbi:MAG: phosphoribosylamine--glycine ligase [Armatimonadetes bacterium]|nr:phosphoribosylamine--glycine ligase [Armatimonadota bacterium]
MKLLVIGGGGREHALVWKLAQSPLAGQILCAPGNAGIAQLATCVPIKANDLDGIVSLAQQEQVDLVVCGPETPLIAGLTDRLHAARIPTFGPSEAAMQIEGSKGWARGLMVKANLPIPEFEVFNDPHEAEAYVRAHPGPLVVKADGEAAGKGALVCDDTDGAVEAVRRIMVEKAFGAAGERVVIEERLEGEEFSAMAFLQDGVILPMPVSQDHKRAYDGDKGPNTGGMGAYSPVPAVTEEMEHEVVDQILKPLVGALAEEGITYNGIIFPGLMITDKGVKIIEFNGRFGDPEAEVLVARMDFDLLEVYHAAAHGELTDATTLAWKPGASACVVMASDGYPGDYETGKPISGLEDAARVEDTVVFHSGTAIGPEGEFVTAGGRVLAVTAWGENGPKALHRAYEAVEKITWDGAFYRKDIGHRLLKSSH